MSVCGIVRDVTMSWPVCKCHQRSGSMNALCRTARAKTIRKNTSTKTRRNENLSVIGLLGGAGAALHNQIPGANNNHNDGDNGHSVELHRIVKRRVSDC